MNTTTSPVTRIVFTLYDGVTQLDFTGPHQVFSALKNVELVLASAHGGSIQAEGGLQFQSSRLSAIDRCDVLCVPGGPGCTNAMADDLFLPEVTRLAAMSDYVTAVCTGSLILGAAGLLQGRRAACHWAWREYLVLFGAVPDDARVVRDGNILTGGGVTAGIDFALVLAKELAGESFAKAIQLGLEYAPDPPFACGRPENAPAELVAATLRALDPTGHRKQAIIRAAEAATPALLRE